MNQFQKGEISFSSFHSEIKGDIPYFVYLPPNWDKQQNYSLVLFLHGQGGDESTFAKYVSAQQLNAWIYENKIQPVVIAGIRGDQDKENVQWFTSENEKLLKGDNEGEFIRFCREQFNAGFDQDVALYGHSRGAAGVIHYYLKYPGSFSKVIAMGYVSDYTLEENKRKAYENLKEIKTKRIPLRLEIGTEDTFVRDKNRKCCFQLHEYFNEIGIEHDFEFLHGVAHRFDYFWNHLTDEGELNGLVHLKFFEK